MTPAGNRVLGDIGFMIGLAAVCLGIGVGWNALSPAPLPIVRPPLDERLALSVERTPSLSAPAGEPARIELEEVLRTGDEGSAQLIDARARDFFESGHLPGALNISRETFARDVSALGGRGGKRLIIYCGGEECGEAVIIARALQRLDFTVAVYAGGWDEWSGAGLPVEP